MINLKKKYQEFLEQPFPEGLAGKEIDGVDLVVLDSEAAGLIQKFIYSKGKLASSDLKLLQQLNGVLEALLSKLEIPNTDYFERLQWLTNHAVTFKEDNKG